MSGGVDSSVAAALLKRDGWDVLGVTLVLKPWDDDRRGGETDSQSAVKQAESVARKLGIEHRVVDRTAQFDDNVLRPAWEEYNRGRTPSPCVVCNPRLKFETLLMLSHELGAEKIATGHYARTVYDEEENVYQLLRGATFNWRRLPAVGFCAALLK